MADPIGSFSGMGPILMGFTITVPSIKGAKPGRNLQKRYKANQPLLIDQASTRFAIVEHFVDF